jgi:hypothetical protein
LPVFAEDAAAGAVLGVDAALHALLELVQHLEIMEAAVLSPTYQPYAADDDQ